MVEVDGRRLRATKNRARIVDAVVEHVVQEGDIPTAQQVADRAGVSIRSVFRLFEDVDSLYAAAIRSRVELARHLFVSPPADAPLAERIRELAAIRAVAFDEIAPVRRVATRLAADAPGIREQFAAANAALRAQVVALFDAELARLPDTDREVAVEALDLATSWETWDRLRTAQRLSRTDAQRVVVHLVARSLPAP